MMKTSWIIITIFLISRFGTRAQESNNEAVTLPDVKTTSALSIAEKIQNAFNFILLSPTSPGTTTSKNVEDVTDATDFDYITVYASTYQPGEADPTTIVEEKTIENTTSTVVSTTVNINSLRPSKSIKNEEYTTDDDVYITIMDTTAFPDKQDTITEAVSPKTKISENPENQELTTADDAYITIIDTTNSPNEQDITTKPTIPKTEITNEKKPFKFVLLTPTITTTTSTIATETKNIPRFQTTTKSDDSPKRIEQSTSLEYETIYASTADYEIEGEEMTTPARTATSSPTPPPTTKKSTTRTTTLLTTKRPTTTYRRIKTSTIKTRSSAKPTENSERIFELQNSGNQFFIISTASTNTKSTWPTPNVEVTNELTIWEDYSTTEENNGSFVAVGGVLPPPGVAGLPEIPAAVPAVLYPNYFVNPGAFWAKYWYWILIVLLLIIILFIVPGFICQIYMSRWCKRRKLDDFFEKRSHLFDFDRIGFGMHLFKPAHTQHDAEAGKSTSSSESGSSSTSADIEAESVQYDQVPVSSLPEADIHQKELETSGPLENVTSVSENATVIVIPNPMSGIGITSLSGSVVESESSIKNPPAFTFPDVLLAPPSRRKPPETPLSTRSRSDLDLDIGNETIIKSNNIAKPSPARVAPPPIRPPKPEHMVPKSQALNVAPESRARQIQPSRPKKEPRDELKRRQKEPTNRPRSDNRKSEQRESQKRKHHPSKDRVTKKSKPEEKTKSKPRKNTESSTQSLMKAAKSLEDLLDAITKLTREYPVPDLPENDVRKQSKPRKDKILEKPHKREKPTSDLPKRQFSGHAHDEMMRNKEKRTKNWASEQRKLEKGRDRERRKEDRKLSRRKEKEHSRKRKKGDAKKRTEKRKDPDSKPEKKEKIPTLVKEEITPQDKVKQERRRMRLERDLKRLQKYHNSVAKEEEQDAE